MNDPNTRVSIEETRYIPALDGLRAFAVGLVIVYHAASSILPGGFIGVDVFFCISGFLITTLLLDEWNKRGMISLPKFYVRRALRLLPALFVMLSVFLVASLVLAPRLTQTLNEALTDSALVLFYLADLSLAAGTGHPQWLGHAWSLSMEEQFYFFWPLLLAGLLSVIRDRRAFLAAGLGLAVIVMTFYRAAVVASGASAWRVYFAPDTHFDPLLMGCALGAAGSLGVFRLAVLRRFGSLAGFTSLVALTSLAATMHWGTPESLTGLQFLVTLFSGLLVVAVMSSRSGYLSRVLSFKFITGIGKISYGLYLWHYPIFRFMQDLGLKGPWVLFGGGALTFGLSLLSYALVERRFLRLKIRFAAR